MLKLYCNACKNHDWWDEYVCKCDKNEREHPDFCPECEDLDVVKEADIYCPYFEITDFALNLLNARELK